MVQWDIFRSMWTRPASPDQTGQSVPEVTAKLIPMTSTHLPPPLILSWDHFEESSQ